MNCSNVLLEYRLDLVHQFPCLDTYAVGTSVTAGTMARARTLKRKNSHHTMIPTMHMYRNEKSKQANSISEPIIVRPKND